MSLILKMKPWQPRAVWKSKTSATKAQDTLREAAETLDSILSYMNFLEDQVTHLEQENIKLKEKLERRANFNKYPEVARINRKQADNYAEQLAGLFQQAQREGCHSNKKIADWLTDKKIPTPREYQQGKDCLTEGNVWHESSVRNYKKRIRKLEPEA